MQIIKSSYEILPEISLADGAEILKKIERHARICYKSEDSISSRSTIHFIEMLLAKGHESVLEHHSLTVKFIVDRAIANELTRHRLASFTQESTRYCNYSKEKFGTGIRIILPNESTIRNKNTIKTISNLAASCEKAYLKLIGNGEPPQIARSVLPLCLATELIVTANLREWRHVLKLRTARDAHPDLQILMLKLLKELDSKIPIIFNNIIKEVK